MASIIASNNVTTASPFLPACRRNVARKIIIAAMLATTSSGGIAASGDCSGKSTHARRFSSQLQACPSQANKPGTICGTSCVESINAQSSPSLSPASAAESAIRSATSPSGGTGTGAASGNALRRPLARGQDILFAVPRAALVRLAFTIGYGWPKVPAMRSSRNAAIHARPGPPR